MQIDALNDRASTRDDVIAPLAWYGGMQLLPQHFQVWDARLEGVLRRQMSAAAPFSWGVDQLQIDPAALVTGKLRLLSARGQFPDGLVFDWSAKQGVSLEFVLSGQADNERVRYALAVPNEDFSENGVNIGRFRQFIGVPVADLTNRDEKAAITRWLPNLSIRKWDPSSEHYLQIPFVEVVKTASGFQATDFHPPTVRLLSDSFCSKQILRMAQILRSKARQLGAPPVPALLGADYKSGLGWVMSALVSGLPRLEAQLNSEVAHPYEILLSLCSIAGAVAPLAGMVPDAFPAYDHHDPTVSMLAVVRSIIDIANNIGVDRRMWQEVPFMLQENVWTCSLPANDTRSEVLVRLSFGPNQSDADIASWLSHTLICLDVDESRCRELRVKGLSRRQHVSLPELGLTALPAQRYVHIHMLSGIDTTGRKLVIGAPDARSAVVLTSISLIVIDQ